MTVTTVYEYDANDGYAGIVNSSWTTANNATTGDASTSGGSIDSVYCRYNPPNYEIYQSFTQYAVSTITGTVSSAVLSTNGGSAGSGTDTYALTLRVFDWGGGISNADYSSGSELGTYTEAATLPWPTATTMWRNWTSTANMAPYIEGASMARFVIASARQIAGVAPTTDYRYNFYSYDSGANKPYLTITWSPTVTGTAAASFTSTRTANGLRTVSGTISPTFSATLATNGTRETFGAAMLAGTLTAGATGLVTHAGTAEVISSLTAGAVGIRETFGTSTITNSISAEGVGVREVSGTSSFSASLTSTVNGVRVVVGNASFVSTESMSADGVVEHVGIASLVGSLQATAVGLRTVNGSISFSPTFTPSILIKTKGVAAFVGLLIATATGRQRTPMYVFTSTSSVALGSTDHTIAVGDTTQDVAMGDNTDSTSSSMIREAL